MQIIPEGGKGLDEFLAEFRLHETGRDLVLLPAQRRDEVFQAIFPDLGDLLFVIAAADQDQDHDKPAEKFPASDFHKKVLSVACILDGLGYLIL
jgi:hypothetical protein